MMNYDEFKNFVRTYIKDYLPGKYREYEISFRDINKASGVNYEGLIISTPSSDVTTTPVINMNSFYREYQEGKEISDILYEMAEVRTKLTLEFDDFSKFENIRSKIYMRLVNTAANKNYLVGKVSTPMEDLSILYTLRIDARVGSIAETIITDELLDYWGVTKNDVITAARLNVNSEEYIFDSLINVVLGTNLELDSEMGFFYLSNKWKVKGAYTAINHTAMNYIYDAIGPFYILPFSTEEVIILSKKKEISVKNALAMVKEINSTELASDEVLSDNVYIYDFGRKKLVKAEVEE